MAKNNIYGELLKKVEEGFAEFAGGLAKNRKEGDFEWGLIPRCAL